VVLVVLVAVVVDYPTLAAVLVPLVKAIMVEVGDSKAAVAAVAEKVQLDRSQQLVQLNQEVMVELEKATQ
jgi:hypothetical protein